MGDVTEKTDSRPAASESTHASSIDLREVNQIPHMSEIGDFELLSISLSNNTTNHTHGLHRFPAKYIPQIPQWALEQFAANNEKVLDPFMGSGTTLVEACMRSGHCSGIDFDPLANLITRAKTTPLSADHLQEIGARLGGLWDRPASSLTVPMGGVKNFSHWFNLESWAWLQSLFEHISSIDCTEDERRFLFVVFSSILRRVSNADDQTQKTYVSGTLKKDPPPVQETFWRAFQRAVAGMSELESAANKHANIDPIFGDAQHLPFIDSDLDLIVTSPPYVDSVDYQYNAMLEYFWLGPILGVSTRPEFNSLRRETIGAKNPTKKTTQALELLDGLINTKEISKSRLPAVLSYYERMHLHFKEAARALKPGGRYVLVVGNSQTTKGILPVHDVLLRLAATEGLVLEKAFAYRIRRHYMKFPRKGRGGIILVDWILVLRKGSPQFEFLERLPLPWLKLAGDEVAN